MSDIQEQTSLMLGDRINWPYILGNAVLTFHRSIIKVEGEQSEQEVREAALTIFNSIPKAWIKADEELKRDLKEATEEVEVDDRPIWCGIRVGPKKTRIEEKLNPYRMYNACVNVFQRHGLLSKTIFTEKIVPAPEDFAELEKEMEKDAKHSEDR